MTIFNKNLDNVDFGDGVKDTSKTLVVSELNEFKESVEISGIWVSDVDQVGVSFSVNPGPNELLSCPRCGGWEDISVGPLEFTSSSLIVEEKCNCGDCGLEWHNTYDIGYNESYVVLDEE